ncbi:nuclear pore complex protein Nup153 [Chelonus insularis]|uniref:nuclear pore complex protein Nup153 n=1 Tax=Chelonus insularis TaxID=460826 RepID=UPI00158D0EA8|nr:nuclear pore complex protein Nup153 [Chelonus insularis]
MAKRSNNNSAGRRIYGEKPYDANNSFVKKVATKVTDLIPQKSWISKWFNTPGGNGEISNEGDNPEEQDVEEETLQPPTKRPRIRMDMTHPPGTFNIKTRGKGVKEKLEYTNEQYPLPDDTINDFLQPSIAARNTVARAFVSSTPSMHPTVRTLNPSRSDTSPFNHQQQQNNVTTNGTDDNSESSESTSGCSSLIPQTNRQENVSTYINYPFAMKKGFNNDKLSFTNHLQSPRSLLFDGRDSASSRRPSFNYSIVSNGKDSVLSSPFYSGNTTFGGANALANFRPGYSNSTDGSDIQLRVPKRASIRVKPSNSSTTTDSSGMSQTAKRILEALEHFSSPISDAKKIPVKTPLHTISGKKRPREEDSPSVSQVGLRHLTRELSVPTVPDMLKLRRRQRLQDTTLAARRIVSALNEPPPQNVSLNANSSEYHLRTESDDKKFFGKLRTNAKKKIDVEEPAETVNLSNIPLPITIMPNFSLPLPPLQNKSNNDLIQKTKSLPSKEPIAFKFSSPVKVTEVTKNLESSHSFKFSEPINIEKEKNKISFKITPITTANSTPYLNSTRSPQSPSTNFMWSGSSTAPRPKEKKIEVNKKEESKGVSVASELKTGSVMDVLGKRSENAVNIWECSECMIKNNDSTDQCIACKALKSNSTKKTSSVSNVTSSIGGNDGQFGAQFKMSHDKWECSSCLVRNPINTLACLSCMAPKQQNKSNSGSSSLVTGKSSSSDAKDVIKSPERTWECPGCMLKNASNVIQCPCCNAAKPGLIKTSQTSVSTKSNESQNSIKTWECPSCMVRNNSTASTCVCCTTSRPDSNSSSNKSTENTPSISVTSGFGDQFKKPAGTWTCDTCMIQNKNDVTKCVACESPKPGTASDTSDKKSSGSSIQFGIPSTPSQFKFGIPKTEEKKTDAPTNGFTFGVPSTQPSTQSFSFGIPKSESSQGTSGFTFLANKSSEKNLISSKSDVEHNSSQPCINPPSSQGFTFGVPKKEEKSSEQGNNKPDKKSSQVIFGIPKSENSEEKPTQPKMIFSNSTTLNTGMTSTAPVTNQQITSTEAKKPSPFSFVPPGSVAGSIGNNTETSSAPSSSNQVSFTFSEPKISKSATPERPVITFKQGSTTNITNATSTSSGFLFTSPKFSEINQASPPGKKPALNFGSTSSSTTAPPVFGVTSSSTTSENNSKDKITSSPFETSINKQDKSSGFTVENKPPVFGVEPKPPETPASAPVFGTSEKSGFINNATPAFTAGPTSAPASTTPMFGSGTILFGNNTPSGFGTPGSLTTSNIFSSVKPAETTPVNNTPGLFSFGGTPSQPPQQNTATGFNFNSNSSSQKSPFVFGNNIATPAQPTPGTGFGTPNFGTSSTNNPTPSPFTFNAPKPEAPPAFGQTSTTQLPSLFNNQTAGNMGQNTLASSFTSTTPGSSGLFSFGAQTPGTGSSTATASSGFNFNASVTPATPSGGFNFNAGSSQTTVNFDPNTKPSFNFTGGSAPTAFNAQPQPPRKIKKAVRRMPARTT